MTSQSVSVLILMFRLRPKSRPTVNDERGVATNVVRSCGLGLLRILNRPKITSAICPAEIMTKSAEGSKSVDQI